MSPRTVIQSAEQATWAMLVRGAQALIIAQKTAEATYVPAN